MPPLDRLRRKYPWPAQRPAVAPSDRGWDCGGRELVTAALAARSARIVLEIGSFVGLSARTWLRAAPAATVICVDPWPDVDVRDWGIRDWPELAGQSLYDVFLSGCWPYRDRVIPVRGGSPGALEEIHAVGVRPDLVYIDGDHSHDAVWRDLWFCSRLFPNAVLCGDDWTWTGKHFPPKSVREAVLEFAASEGGRVEASGNTWVLHRSPPPLRRVGRWLQSFFRRTVRRAG